MSHKNAQVVQGFLLGPDVDVAPLFRNDEMWAALVEVVTPVFHPEIECYVHMLEGDWSDAGLDGFRSLYLRWLAPWVTYRQEIEEVVALGERVLVLPHDFGRREVSTQEVEGKTAVLFSFRDGKIVRWEVYMVRGEGLKAVGLAE